MSHRHRLSALERRLARQHSISLKLQAISVALSDEERATLATVRQRSFEEAWVMLMEIGRRKAPAAAAAIERELGRRQRLAHGAWGAWGAT